MDNLPNGSHRAEERNIKPVVSAGDVTMRQPGLAKKTRGFFNIDGIGKYLMDTIFKPAVKDTIYDLLTKGGSYAIYGDNKPAGTMLRSNQSTQRGTTVNYAGFSQTSNRTATKQDYTYGPTLPDLVFESRAKAQEVYDAIVNIFSRFNNVSVQDIYEICGMTCPYTFQNWGYFDISSFKVMKNYYGWEIVLPRPEPLK